MSGRVDLSRAGVDTPRKLLYLRFGRNIVVPLSELERFIDTTVKADSESVL